MPAFLAHAHSDESVGADVLVVPLASTSDLHARLSREGRGVAAAAVRAADLGDFTAEPGSRLLVHARGIERFPRLMLLGIDAGAKPRALRTTFAGLAQDPVFGRTDSVAVLATPDLGEGAALAEAVAAAVDGLLHGAYRWTRATKDRPRSPGRYVFLGESARALTRVREGIERGRALGDAVVACREMANTPANLMGPAELAAAAESLAKDFGLRSRVLTRRQLERENMEAMLTVGAASVREPRLAVVEYDGGGGDWIALVGKGLVYDTGGLSLKPNTSMVEMKFDKCGACAVLGTIRAAAALGLKQRIVAVVPAVENSVSGTAYRPGDVIGSRSGQTIEVLNTDAEGRLVLADALDWAITKYEPQAVLDAATLTGAAFYALGDHSCALLGNDETLIARVKEAGERSGEYAWPLPLRDEYRRDVDSNFADVRNTSAHGAGTIAGAAFLERFVRDVPWAHLDIGCVARDRRDPKVGATGFGVRVLTEALAAWPVSRATPKARAKAEAKGKAKAAAKGRAKRKAAGKAKRKAAGKAKGKAASKGRRKTAAKRRRKTTRKATRKRSR
jgi:leucyl aminopeptidase